MKGRLDEAAVVLERLRDQPAGSELIQAELTEIIANHEYEMSVIPQGGYFASWANCFTGSLWNGASNLRRTILGTSMQMMQQWTGINFIFYFGTTFFTQLGTINNPFLISLVTTLVNVLSTPVSFWIIEKYGRRTIMIWGALGMVISQFIIAIIGTITDEAAAVKTMIAFICIFVFFFASTWGPGAWVVIGEIFPLPIRSRGVALSTASNWLWNCVSFTFLILKALTRLIRNTDYHCHHTLYHLNSRWRCRHGSQGLLALGRSLHMLPGLLLFLDPRD